MPLKAGARMSLDSSFEKAKLLCADIQGRIPEIETEQDARVQVINRFLTEILGWSFPDIKTEKYNVAGYADYLISSGERRRLVIEAWSGRVTECLALNCAAAIGRGFQRRV